jgi:hypothetical protein
MSSLNITKNNNITFQRLKNVNVTSYNIYTLELLADGSVDKKLLGNIANPKEPQLSLHSKILAYRKSQTFDLPKEVYTDFDHPVEVYINDIKLDNMFKTYNDKLKMLTIVRSLILKDTDKIEVKYYRDVIKYTHNTDKDYNYCIEPVMEFTHNMGTHNVIK